LLATQVISRIRATFGVELPISELFESPTVAGIAQALQARLTDSAHRAPPLVPVARTGALPLSFAQQRLWFLEQFEPGNTTYNLFTAVRMEGTLDVSSLEQGFQELVRRHESLRTTFQSTEQGPLQVIHPEASLPLPLIDLGSVPETQHETEVLRLAREEAGRSFDLIHGPLLRVKLLKLGEARHVLLMTMHHIVSDGWSMSILIREVAALYQAFVAGEPSPLTELPVQYADYADWQRGWLRDEALEAQLAYWRQQLAHAPQVLELPTDKPRPAVQTYRGALHTVMLPVELSRAVTALGQREGATPFMVFLAAFQALLSRYSGQRDISVGSPIAGRTHVGTEDLIGFFVNTLVLRTRLEGNPSFRELLGRVRQVALGAYAHQDIPFEKLVEELKPQRSLSHPPLFQVMLAFQNTPASRLEQPGLALSTLAPESQTALFDLTLSLQDTPEGLAATLEYNTDLFESATAVRMLGHLRVLLEAATSQPELPLSALPLLTEAERHQVLVQWNDTQADYPRDACLHHLFEAQVERTPDALAVLLGGDSLTYRQLDARANQLAHELRSLGVGPEVRVGVCFERSLDLVIALLGILKAGGAYVPLDPSLPRERLAFMAEDSAAHVLLTQQALRNVLPVTGQQVLCLDSAWEALSTRPQHAPAVPVLADNLAYVIYTSGSTGRPKGTLLRHRGVSNLVVQEAKAYGVGPESRMLQFANLSFDLSVEEIFTTLTAGGTLCLAPLEKLMPGEPLRRLLRELDITVLSLTPATLAATPAEDLPALRTVISGGEACPADLVARWGQGRRFLNTYGPTEATVVASLTDCVPDGKAPSIGRPLPNVRMYVLDTHMTPVPVGVRGELYLGGEGVARGYLGRPELTAEKFVPDPFSGEPGARLYRTGDLVRYLPDGHLEFQGRIDSQVKVRGFRIELGEVESALLAHPTVYEAVVAAREDGPGGKRLVAYVVARGHELDTGELRRFARARLPEYMVPSAFVPLEALPLTPSGKVDHKALPAPDATRSSQDRPRTPARTPTEQLLASIWAQVLHIREVDANDNFFELGGHSLLATQVVSRVRAAFGVELSLRALFEEPTLAALATRLESASRESQGVRLPPLMPVTRTGELPLSFAQQRLWFLDQLEPGSATYNLFTAVRMEGTLDVSALERSFQELVHRHESLRTTFRSTDTEAVQVIHPELSLPLSVVDLGSVPGAEHETQVQRLAREETQSPFDLIRGPLLRVKLLKLGETQHVLVLTMHHIVSDGWSMGVLIKEVAALYQAFASGQPSPLPGLPLQYADYASWQRQWLRDEALETQLAYWRQQLAQAPQVLELPTDRPRPAVQTYRGANHSVMLPAELSRAVTALGQREGATPFMVLLAAFQALLSRYSGQRDISVGSPIAGRTHADTEGLIGFFVNTLVLRTRLEGNPSFRELLGRVRQVALGAYAHQDVPFEKLVEELKPQRSLSHSPLFQVMLTFQNTPTSRIDLPGLALNSLAPESHTAKFDLTLALEDTTEGLAATLEYNTDLFEPETAARMLGHLRVLLEAATANPELSLSALPLLPEAERQQVLVQWNDTRADYPREACIHHLFEAQVERTPNATALVAGDVRLSYRELNARSNRLAHYLRRLGVRPESRVGICLERNEDLLTGLLAIL
ncbi:MAG TPA: amino acid adenylation domain-containing protein, partial [Archangium sp.]|uniref:amino acid adenylation domain-containing protein n=1 Tax=Archangium sp. TaxID=1872627 RepID=UPI002ED91997